MKSDRGKPTHSGLQFPPSVVPQNQIFPQSLPKQKRAHGKGLLSLREKLKNLKA